MADTADFFKTDPSGKVVYTNREHECQAPEQVWEFDSRFETVNPGSGERIAFGFLRSLADDEWKGTGMVDHDWDSFGPWKLKEN